MTLGCNAPEAAAAEPISPRSWGHDEAAQCYGAASA